MVQWNPNFDRIPKNYLFAELSANVRKLKEQGKDVIKLHIGEMDEELPPDFKIRKAIANALTTKKEGYNTNFMGYPGDVEPFSGLPKLIEEICNWYNEKFGVDIKPTQICVGQWAKPSLFNAAILFKLREPPENGGERKSIIVPEPIYPVYRNSTLIYDGNVHILPTKKEDKWLPRFENIPEKDIKKSVAFYFNNPNNPTTAVADLEYYRKLADFVRKHNLGGIIDAAYIDMVYSGQKAPSITQVPELLNNCFEFVSTSKSHMMTGIGFSWVVSSEENINRWKKFQTNFTQGVNNFLQKGFEIFRTPAVEEKRKKDLETVAKRIDILYTGFRKIGLNCEKPRATPYLWVEVPKGHTSEGFTTKVLNEIFVSLTPGSGFGKSGEGYFRATVYQPENKLKEVIKRMEEKRFW